MGRLFLFVVLVSYRLCEFRIPVYDDAKNVSSVHSVSWHGPCLGTDNTADCLLAIHKSVTLLHLTITTSTPEKKRVDQDDLSKITKIV